MTNIIFQQPVLCQWHFMVAKDNGICQDDTFLMCGSQDRPLYFLHPSNHNFSKEMKNEGLQDNKARESFENMGEKLLSRWHLSIHAQSHQSLRQHQSWPRNWLWKPTSHGSLPWSIFQWPTALIQIHQRDVRAELKWSSWTKTYFWGEIVDSTAKSRVVICQDFCECSKVCVCVCWP